MDSEKASLEVDTALESVTSDNDLSQRKFRRTHSLKIRKIRRLPCFMVLTFTFLASFMLAVGVYARETKGTKVTVRGLGSSHLKVERRFGFKVIDQNYDFGDKQIPYKVGIWYPSDDSPTQYNYCIGPSKILSEAAYNGRVSDGKYPLIVYAHGATGAGTSSFFLCELLAESGYIVAAPDFLDPVYVARIQEPVVYDPYASMRFNEYIYWLRQYGLNKAAGEGRERFAYRPKQLRATIDHLLKLNSENGSFVFNRIDPKKIGVVGHSFGAWTAIVSSGADKSLKDRRIRVVAALSGPVNRKVYAVDSTNDLKGVRIPILFEYGENEGESEFKRQGDKELLFDKANRPKVLYCIRNADHFSFSGGVLGRHKRSSEYRTLDPARRAISETTRDFFDAFLKGDSSAKENLSRAKEGVASSFVEF